MLKQPVDTTKELKFYTSKRVIALRIFLTLIFGLMFYFSLPGQQSNSVLNSSEIFFFGAGSLFFLAQSIYGFAYNPLLLKINKDGVYLRWGGNILWSNIESISIVRPKYSAWSGLQTYLKIVLKDGTFKALMTGPMMTNTDDLVNLLKTYQGTV